MPDLSGIPNVPDNRIDLGVNGETGENHEAEWLRKIENIVSAFGPGGTFWETHPGLEGKYAPNIWEIWNEENYGTNGTPPGDVDTALYGRLLESSHDAITRVAPQAEILFGGLLTVKRKPGEVEHVAVGRFIAEVGHANYYQALSLHPYAFSGVPNKCKGSPKCSHAPQVPMSSADVGFVTTSVKRNILAARHGLNAVEGRSKKIWITELGWPVGGPNDHTHLPVSQQIQSDLLNSTFSMIKREANLASLGGLGIQNVFYCNIQDYVNPKNTWDYHCGLREEEGNGAGGRYRKAWYAFQNQSGYGENGESYP